MRSRTPVTLFPFLSVLISTMGVLAFLAVTFLLFTRQEQIPPQAEKPVEVKWIGAPGHVLPLLVECLSDGVRVHFGDGEAPLFFSRQALEEEVKIVKAIAKQGQSRPAVARDRYRFWLFMKDALRQERGLDNSFTMAMNRLELYNLSREGRRQFKQKYPILLVYAKGIGSYELAAYLVDTTTRLHTGLEPMLKGWRLPYADLSS